MATAARRTHQIGLEPPPLGLAAGAYLTDESSLFRCLSVTQVPDPDATALLEDCLTLELIILPLAELDPAKLRIVKPEQGSPGPATPCGVSPREAHAGRRRSRRGEE